MFTGIITEIGEVKSIVRKGPSARLEIACKKVGKDINLGDSVAVNGVCLSVVDASDSLFFDVVGNTLSKTVFKRLKAGDAVNLESALKLGDTLSGHMVSGHVDGERVVKNNRKISGDQVLDIGILPGDEKYLLARGSVAVDGVSLTVGELSRGFFRIYLIPHTLDNSTLKSKRPGDYVNVEFDMMAKYAERNSQKGTITGDMLVEKGFM